MPKASSQGTKHWLNIRNNMIRADPCSHQHNLCPCLRRSSSSAFFSSVTTISASLSSNCLAGPTPLPHIAIYCHHELDKKKKNKFSNGLNFKTWNRYGTEQYSDQPFFNHISSTSIYLTAGFTQFPIGIRAKLFPHNDILEISVRIWKRHRRTSNPLNSMDFINAYNGLAGHVTRVQKASAPCASNQD